MLYLLLVGKKKKTKNKRAMVRGLFFPGPDMPCWLCHVGFLQLLGAIKGCFKGQSLNFICT
jgi:hypothetical protein